MIRIWIFCDANDQVIRDMITLARERPLELVTSAEPPTRQNLNGWIVTKCQVYIDAHLETIRALAGYRPT